MGDYVKVIRNATQAIAVNTMTDVAFDTESVDAAGYFTLGAPTRITVPTGKAGEFIFSASVFMDGTAPQERALLQLTVYNSLNVAQAGYRYPHGYQDNLGDTTEQMPLNDGDYVILQVYQSWNSGTRNLTATLEMFRLN